MNNGRSITVRINDRGPFTLGRVIDLTTAGTQGPTLLTKLFTGTRNFASGFFTTVRFLFFLLVSGDIFMHRLVEIMPRFSGKPNAIRSIKGLSYGSALDGALSLSWKKIQYCKQNSE